MARYCPHHVQGNGRWLDEACLPSKRGRWDLPHGHLSLHESEPRSSSADTCKAYWWIGAQHQGHEAEWQQAVCGSAELPCQMRYQLLSHGAVTSRRQASLIVAGRVQSLLAVSQNVWRVLGGASRPQLGCSTSSRFPIFLEPSVPVGLDGRSALNAHD